MDLSPFSLLTAQERTRMLKSEMVDCKECFKFYNRVMPKGCAFCHDYQFQENILCDLLRVGKNEHELECHAFKHNLSVIGKDKKSYEFIDDREEIKLSDRQKWLKAYAFQQWKSDPDKIFSNLSFHLCLLIKKRENLLDKIQEKLDEISSIFVDSGDQYDGKVSFLCAGRDHIHLHIELSPDYAPDEIVRKISTFSEHEIISKLPELLEYKDGLFEKTYFIETIGC